MSLQIEHYSVEMERRLKQAQERMEHAGKESMQKEEQIKQPYMR